MKQLILTLSISFCWFASSRAASVLVTDSLIKTTDEGNFHYVDDTHLYVPLEDSRGQSLGNGNLVRVGYFSGYTPAMDDVLRTTPPASLFTGVNRFVPLGEGASGDGLGGDNTANLITKTLASVDGRIATNMSGINYLPGAANQATTGGINAGTKLFVFVFNGASVDESSEWGLFSGTTWIVPAAGSLAATQLFLKDIDTQAEIYHGALGSLHTAPAPEPSSAVLAVLGVLGLVRRRR